MLAIISFLIRALFLVEKNQKEIESLIAKTNALIKEGFLEKNSINELEFLQLEMLSLLNDFKNKSKATTLSIKNKLDTPWIVPFPLPLAFHQHYPALLTLKQIKTILVG